MLYSDQAQTYLNGEYVPQHLSEEDVAKTAQGTLRLVPVTDLWELSLLAIGLDAI
ncbi:hypothetical protein NLO88_13100 [Pseudomonas syringae]|nr:hypothetical protein [Pseudomonas syringae]